jgi:hypothetical protein
MSVDFPKTADAITKEWLSGVLGTKVTGYETTFLEGGVLADAFKLHGITYADGPAAGPPSVVVKLANAVKERRDMALMTNAYTKELLFFRDLASKVPVGSPKVYGLFMDGTETSETFMIVMEDLTLHSKVFDQVDDPPNAAFARKVALEAAAMHAKFWESETTRLPWLGRADGRYVFSLDSLSKMADQSLAPLQGLWSQMFGRALFTPGQDDEVKELTELLCGSKSAAILERIYDVLSSRPKTLLHGDMRADNTFRTDPAQGKSIEDTKLTFIDWQVIHAGPPGPEFTQAWFNSLEPDVRAHDREILREYHARLVQLNPAAAAYTYDMLIEDYALSMCFWWMAIITLGVGTVPVFDKPEGTRMKLLWGKALPRALLAMRDLECLARVKRLAAELD